MKVNLAWLQELVDIPIDKDELLTRINSQLGEIEAVWDWGERYRGALIVSIVSIRPHPKSSKLSICLIDDGGVCGDVDRSEQGLVEVVCGASGLREGMWVCWLPPGAVVPATCWTDCPQKLSVKTIAEVRSYGMLASPLELGLGDEDRSLLDLQGATTTGSLNEPTSFKPGQSFAAVFGLDTSIIEIENKMFTHRPDCFGLLGVAREVAAIIQSPWQSPDWYRDAPLVSSNSLQQDDHLRLFVDCPELVSRLRAYHLTDLTIQPSPLNLQFKLASVGIKAINNVVDLTNYVMYFTGQPVHAFDATKLREQSQKTTKQLSLGARLCRKGEQLKLLNGKILNFDQPAIVIATDKKPVALAGIMGGMETEVDSQTREVVLECANFDMYSVRRATMYYGVFSEAATRFTKGQSSRQIPAVGDFAADLLAEMAGESSRHQIYEISSPLSDQPPVSVTATFINERLGSQLITQTIVDILEGVEFGIQLKEADILEVTPPFYRTDIEIAEDLVEEVGRLNGGYQTLTPQLPRQPMQAVDTDGLLTLKNQIRQCWSAAGANEVLNYSFTSESWLQQFDQNPQDSFHLSNPLSPQVALYRQSLTPSLVSAAMTNIDFRHKHFVLFEIGVVHRRDRSLVDKEGLPLDLERFGLIGVNQKASPGSCFYLLRRYLDLLAKHFGLSFEYTRFNADTGLDSALVAPYNPALSALVSVGDQPLGILGLLKENHLAAAELKTDVLRATDWQQTGSSYQPLSRYPFSQQDLTLQVDLKVGYGDLNRSLHETLVTYREEGWQITCQPLSIFQPDSAVKNISFRLTFYHLSQTPDKTKVAQIVKALVKMVDQRYGGKHVG